MSKKNKKAFTLAEVLITLAIIGVVAAMTISVLAQGYKKKETPVRLKHFYSTMAQALEMSKIDHGEFREWSFIASGGAVNDYNFIMEYIAPYLKYLDIKTIQYDRGGGSMFDSNLITLTNGSYVVMYSGSLFDLILDTNGENLRINGAATSLIFS